MRLVSTLPRSFSGRLLQWAAFGAVLVPEVAFAHGEGALSIALLLPVSVVPVVFLASVWFWRIDAETKLLTGLLLVVVGVALDWINLALLDVFANLTRSAPRTVGVLMWFGPPIVVQGAAWALFARWRRRRMAQQ